MIIVIFSRPTRKLIGFQSSSSTLSLTASSGDWTTRNGNQNSFPRKDYSVSPPLPVGLLLTLHFSLDFTGAISVQS